MQRCFSFMKKEAVLCISGVLALASMLLIPPDSTYFSYIDYSTLATLFCLMLVVAGLTDAGVFRALTAALLRRVTSPRVMIFMLVLLCFFVSAFVTNDVSLITFVPFTIGLLGVQDQKRLIGTVVLETVAANLGSLITPMGNPQNLFLYHFYAYTTPDFLLVMLPLGMASLVICIVLAFLVPKGAPRIQNENVELSGSGTTAVKNVTQTGIVRKQAVIWGIAFLLCIVCVAGIIPWWICLPITALVALLTNRRLFTKVDYSLLVTFVFFFLFVGNVARVDAVSQWIRSALEGRELLVGALTSQVISNVPAATMLAAFTDNARGLLYGVNIGGLGTLIASMASLISYRRYAASEHARRGLYLAVFSVVNFALLALLVVIFM